MVDMPTVVGAVNQSFLKALLRFWKLKVRFWEEVIWVFWKLVLNWESEVRSSRYWQGEKLRQGFFISRNRRSLRGGVKFCCLISPIWVDIRNVNCGAVLPLSHLKKVWIFSENFLVIDISFKNISSLGLGSSKIFRLGIVLKSSPFSVYFPRFDCKPNSENLVTREVRHHTHTREYRP